MKFTKQQMRTGNNRLMALVDKLRYGVPEEQFNYRQWVGKDWQGKSDLSCGTKACALGWATTIPSLRKCGLRLQLGQTNSWGEKTWGTVVNIKDTSVDDPFEIAEKIFALTYEQSEHLFAPSLDSDVDESNFTARQVADKIEMFVLNRAAILDSLK